MKFATAQSLFRWAATIAAALLAVACIAGVLRAAAPVSAQACSWTGTWIVSGNSKITLTQNGNQVSGGDGGNAHVSGTVSGNTLTGGWTYGSDHGALVAQMDGSCNSFTGFEGLNGSTSVTSQTGNPFNGTRSGGSSAPTPSPSSPSSGQLQKLGSVDWNGYCISQGGSGASLDGGTINDWHCVDASGKHVGIDSGAACQWQYQPNAVGRWDTFTDPNSWACFGAASSSPGPSTSSSGQLQKLGSVDWNGYCQSLGGSGASLDGGTINDWHCVDASGKHAGIDSGAACQWQYQPNAIGRWDTFTDPNSWACFGAAASSPAPGRTPANAKSIDWTTNATDHSQDAGKQFAYICPPAGSANNVWGTDLYTDDSSICTAGVHAGLISFANGGTVTIQMVTGQNSYSGSTRNGVTTVDWGSWDSSFRFVH